jgi:hypothetical protein
VVDIKDARMVFNMLAITVAEYTKWRQPDLYWIFSEYGLSEEPMSRDALEVKAKVRENHVFEWWDRIMRECPKPS